LAKGIRVNQLAKELGVESKSILKKLADEGIPNVPNHMSLLQLGLAETVRDWVRDGLIASSGGVATEVAEEEAPPAKAKGSKRKKPAGEEPEPVAEEAAHVEPQAADASVSEAPAEVPQGEAPGEYAEDDAGGAGAGAGVETPEAEAPAESEEPTTAAPVASAPEAAAPKAAASPMAPVAKAAPKAVPPVSFQPQAATVMGPKVVQHAPTSPGGTVRPPRFGQKVARPNAPAAPPAPGPRAPIAPKAPVVVAPVVPPPAPVAPAAPAAPAAPGNVPPRVGAPGHNRLAADGSVLRQESRPTVSLNNPSSLRPAERKPIVPAPKLVVPTPAQIQGPKLIRMEKPEHVAAPRPRGPIRPDNAPSLNPARPGVGRGVKPTVGAEDEESDAKKAAAKNRGSLSARRRGLDGRRGEAEERLKEFTEADLIARQDMLNAAAATRAGMESHLKKTGAKGTHLVSKTAVQRGGEVEVEEPITIKTLSGALGVKSNDIIKALMRKKIMATINQTITIELASEIALDYGLELKVAQEVPADERLMIEYDEALAESTSMEPRPAVVTILGHVDHGKTSLLDKIRSANVAAGEAGGITQHIAAWTVSVGVEGAKKRVTFIDTPGHQAFTSMRARGANMTDVVVLVVSAAEGVQPQTIESINHAKAAEVPIVVAMNKIDRADANPDMVLGQLAANGLNPVEWGGDTEVVRVSALTGQGIPELIEILDYQSQLLELKADPTMPARGTVIEARRDEGMGPVATVLVQEGTLTVGDVVLCGPGYGRVRTLLDDRGNHIKEAGPSTPVIVSGLSEIPSSGDVMLCVADLDEAKTIAEDRAVRSRQKTLAGLQQRTTGANLIATIKAGEVQTINLIIKADTQGSIETLIKTVTDSNTEEVKVRVIHSGVGAVTESDVELAMATKGKPTDNRVAIIGFHVVPDETARALAEHNHIDVKTYRVIYEIFDDLKKALSGMLAPEEREKYHGRAEIRQVFKVSRVGNIAGCMVIDGHIQRGSKIRLLRNAAIVVEDLSIETLKRVKDDAKEVKQGFECGIKLANYDDIKIGDILEAYIKETFERTL
jgi:translation initiation factor IF-2